MSSSTARLPAAIQAFPTLRRFLALRPRRIAAVPLGHSASSADETVKPACARHLYHDMGVIAFAGTNPLQTERLGDLLHATVGAGGPGAMATSAEWAAIAPHHGVRRKRTRVESLEEGDVFDAENSGIIKPRAILRIADQVFAEQIRALVQDAGLSCEDVQLRERQVHVRDSPRPSGIISHLATGPRRLPVDAFTLLTHDPRNGLLLGQMQLYTAAGRGEYVGGCLVDYALHHRRTGRPVRLPDELPPLANPSSSSSSSSSVSSYDDILRGVWQLEAEIYGDKAEGDGAVVIPPDDILPEDDEARLEAAREAEEQAQAQFRQSEKAKSGR